MTTNLDSVLDDIVGPPSAPIARSESPSPASLAVNGSRARLEEVPLADLHPDPNNPREDVGDVTELAKSMAAAGLLQPIIARRDTATGRLVVVAGHRRLAAAQHLKWPRVQVVIRRDMAPDRVLAAMLIENGQRAGLDPIEEARALGRIRDEKGLNHADLALMIGRSQPYVSGRLALLSLSPAEQEELREGFGTLTSAIRKARVDSGRVKPTAVGKKSAAHLDSRHTLASRVAARCRTKKHKRGGGASIGKVGCGECWEAVIRADEREQLNRQSNERGRCVLCDVEHDHDATEPAGIVL